MLDPLVGVGPLRFGMSPDQVRDALGGAIAYVSQGLEDSLSWQRYDGFEVTAIYGPGPRLVAVAVDALSGPLVRLGEVELIDRVPSEVRADLVELAHREGVSVRVNWSGDPEVAAWGLSMGAGKGWALSPEGYAERTDRMVTDALFVGPEPAEDPYRSEPVKSWRNVQEWDANPGDWPVRADRDRPRWDCTPLEGVGPLRFGMSPSQVVAALGGDAPAVRRGRYAWAWRGAEPWCLEEDRFDRAGVTAHYWHPEGVPTLGAVTVHGRTGPRVAFEGIELIGRPVSEVDAAVVRYVEERDLGLRIGCAGDQGPDGTNLYVRADRAGDAVVTGARFCAPDWEDHG
ncbi:MULTISPECIES: hypothetical protein [Kitasatospora]|uniref:Uncharacterized protein n=1 Tax=Kitasatospora cathayae TaxID=3004092 RepID=A0ABY7Q337_9ACTN|nr:hypothetical protein [Kitasatospora sp. HUAS 3-15]WBP87100.1 hypothetical protein O1G21_15445 [Kitasatospora sp. HUAS 3-15]